MDHQVPADSFIQEVLSKGLTTDGNNVTITKLTLEKGISRNDSTISFCVQCCYRRSHEEKEITSNFVVISQAKTATAEEVAKFQERISFSRLVLLNVQNILKSVDENVPFPQIVYCDSHIPVIVLSDQEKVKFKPIDYISPWHKVEILKDLANFHAASLKIDKQSQDIITTDNWLLNKPKNTLCNSLNRVLPLIETIADGKWCHILKNNFDKFTSPILIAYSELKDILIHGDLRLCNILLRYRGCGLYDASFDNFCSSECSPIIDIMYLVFTNFTTSTNFKEEISTLLKVYVQQFNNTCMRIGSDRCITLEAFTEHFDANIHLEFAIFYSLVPILVCPAHIERNMCIKNYLKSEILDEEYDNAFFKELIAKGLAYFEDRGLFQK